MRDIRYHPHRLRQCAAAGPRPRISFFAALAAAVVLAATAACGASAPNPAFYYWRTSWSPTPELLAGLAGNNVGRVYARFFDVDWDAATGAPAPVAPLRFDGAWPAGVEAVPVVYLTNEVFLRTRAPAALAARVWTKAAAMADAQGLKPKEIQVDCDWSDASRARYFAFVAALRKLAAARGVALSATIRLHQVKYARRTGVPPVDRGMLMFYNMGRLQAGSPRPSIYNAEDAAAYAASIARYPLPLDVALPVFSWLVHERDGRIVGLVENADATALDAAPGFALSEPGAYRARDSFFFRGNWLRRGDVLRVESMDPALTRAAAAQAAAGAGQGRAFGTVAFFALDEGRLKRYAPTDFKRILHAFE